MPDRGTADLPQSTTLSSCTFGDSLVCVGLHGLCVIRSPPLVGQRGTASPGITINGAGGTRTQEARHTFGGDLVMLCGAELSWGAQQGDMNGDGGKSTACQASRRAPEVIH